MRYYLVCWILLTTQVAFATPDHSEARSFVKEAVIEQLQDRSLTAETRDLILAVDSDGNPLSFIPGCPICLGVQDAFRTVVTSESNENIPPDWTAEKPSTRTLAVAQFVRAAVKSKLDTIDDFQAKLAMAEKLRKGNEEGQSQLARYQSKETEAYRMMWSCLMCDAVVKAGK